MRHFKRRFRIIWALLTNAYTNSDRQSRWWLWTKGEAITIKFDECFDDEDRNA